LSHVKFSLEVTFICHKAANNQYGLGEYHTQ